MPLVPAEVGRISNPQYERWRDTPSAAAVCLGFAQSTVATLWGKLVEPGDRPPSIETAANQRAALDGDAQTLAVFVVGPFYTSKSMFVHKDGKKYTISYWETDLDLVEVQSGGWPAPSSPRSPCPTHRPIPPGRPPSIRSRWSG